MLFDGRAEAVEDELAGAASLKGQIAKQRARLLVPPAATDVAKLAKVYRNGPLGNVTVQTKGSTTRFDFGEWSSAVASRKNDDGSTSYYTIDPGVSGFEFVVGEVRGERVLVTRDMRHEYVFEETK